MAAKTTATKTTAKKATAKKAPATKATTKKKKRDDKPVTSLLTSVTDSTKDLLDDVLKTAGDLEKKARKQLDKTSKKVVPSKADVDDMRDRVRDLTKSVEKIARTRTGKK